MLDCLRILLVLTCLGSGIAWPADDVERVYGGRTLPQWREFLKTTPQELQGTPEIVAGLIEIAADPSAPWADRRRSALTLGRIGEPAASAVPWLIRLLHPQEQDVSSTQLWSLKALGLMGPPAVEATAAVRGLVVDSSAPFLIRSTAMETLARIEPEEAITLQTFITLLQSDHLAQNPHDQNELRRSAAEALALLGPAAAPAQPELLRALQSDWPLLQRSAATALGALGPRGELAVTPLVDAVLFDASADVREAAADALGAIGPPAIPALQQLLGDMEILVRRLAIRGLKRSGDAAAASQALTQALPDEVPLVRVEAAAALLQFRPDPAAVPVLLAGLSDSDRHARLTAFRTLRDHADQLIPHRDALQQLADDPLRSAQTRQSARRLLELAK